MDIPFPMEVESCSNFWCKINIRASGKSRTARGRYASTLGDAAVELTVYESTEAIGDLWHRNTPGGSITGIILASVSQVVMPMLARAKRPVARSIASIVLKADAQQTEFCTYLSASPLGGLLLNALQGWWRADPVAALTMVPIIAFKATIGRLSLTDSIFAPWNSQIRTSFERYVEPRRYTNSPFKWEHRVLAGPIAS